MKKQLKEYDTSFDQKWNTDDGPIWRAFAKNKALSFVSKFKDRFIIVDAKTKSYFLIITTDNNGIPKDWGFTYDIYSTIPFKTVDSAKKFLAIYSNLKPWNDKNVNLSYMQCEIVPVSSINTRDYTRLSIGDFKKKYYITEKVEVNDWDVEEEMTLQVETPNGDTTITFEGELNTIRWILDILRQHINNNSDLRSECYIYKK
jgi:hypothetical protein